MILIRAIGVIRGFWRSPRPRIMPTCAQRSRAAGATVVRRPPQVWQVSSFHSRDHLFSSSRASVRDNDGAGLRVRDDADSRGKPGRLRKVVSMD